MVPMFLRFYNAYPIFHEYEVLNGRGFFCKWPIFSLDFWHEIFSYFFSCSIISSMYLKNDVYFCVFRSVKPLLHDSKCEKLVPKNGRKQRNKLQKIKVRKIWILFQKFVEKSWILFQKFVTICLSVSFIGCFSLEFPTER